jgi:hypothetical protein
MRRGMSDGQLLALALGIGAALAKIAGNCPVSYVDLGRSFESCIAACADPGDGL